MKTLVAGVGNIFLTDDGFGSEVVRELQRRGVPDGVVLNDFGIGSVHLVYELMNGYDLTVLVDAMPRDEPPGTVYIVEPHYGEMPGSDEAALMHDAHGLAPESALVLVETLRQRLGGALGRVVVVGCEPESVADGIGLTPPVAAAVEPAAQAVLDLVREGR